MILSYEKCAVRKPLYIFGIASGYRYLIHAIWAKRNGMAGDWRTIAEAMQNKIDCSG
jgi:hypothetical protein